MTKKMTISEHLKSAEEARSHLDDAVKGIQKNFNNKNLGWSLHFRFDDDGVEWIEEHFHKDGHDWGDVLNVYGIEREGEISYYDEKEKYTKEEIKELSDIVKVWRKETITIEKEQWRL